MAAAAQRDKNPEEAAQWYVRLLERDPADSLASAGLLSLQGVVNPVEGESRVKNLLRREPEARKLAGQPRRGSSTRYHRGGYACRPVTV